jgi:hypothetical protein
VDLGADTGGAGGGDRLGLSPEQGGKQPGPVLELIRGGEYLNHPMLFFNRYLAGVVLNNMAVFSLLVTFSAAVALFWRWPDRLTTRWWITDTLAAVGKQLPDWSPITREHVEFFGDDLGVAFLPALLLFSLWVAAWGVALGSRWFWPRLADLVAGGTTYLLFFSGLCFLVGCAVLLGNGDISAGGREAFRVSQPVLLALGVLGLVLLLPIIRPWRFVGSGQRPQGPFDPYVFRITSTALLVGVPLGLVFFLARENLSGYADFSVDEVSHWKEFCEAIRDEGRPSPRRTWPASFIWDRIGERPKYAIDFMTDVWDMNHKRDGRYEGCQVMVASTAGLIGPPQGPGLFLAISALFPERGDDCWPIGALQDMFNQVDIRPALGTTQGSQYPPVVKRRQLFVRALNDALSDPRFLQQIPPDSRLRKNFDKVLEEKLNDLKKSRGTDEEAPAAKFPKTRLINLWEKYWYLDEHKEEAEEFKREFDKEPLRRELGQLLLALHYHRFVPHEKSAVKRVVVIDKDQETRWKWFWISLAVFCVLTVVVNLNQTSMHRFYSDQLAETFVAEGEGGRRPALADLARNAGAGAPYHLLTATLTLYPPILKTLFGSNFVRSLKSLLGLQVARAAEGRPTDAFLFSPLYCGSDTTNYHATHDFRVGGEAVTLADAMAVSGAAFSPLRGRNPLMRMLMLILNLRLGQWVPNPYLKSLPRWWGRLLDLWVYERPSIFTLVAFNLLPALKNRTLCFVTDGGHHENLGVWPLLQRRCFLIIASDASQDTAHSFEDFLRLCRRARLEKGINIIDLQSAEELDLPLQMHSLRLRPDGPSLPSPTLRSLAERFSQKHYLVARIKYPPPPGAAEGPVGYLIYLKSSLTGDEENDLVGYSAENRAFPHDPTTNAVFDEEHVESYRQLGYHIAEGLCRDLVRAQTLPRRGAPAAAAPGGWCPGKTPPEQFLWLWGSFVIKDIVSRLTRQVPGTGPAVELAPLPLPERAPAEEQERPGFALLLKPSLDEELKHLGQHLERILSPEERDDAKLRLKQIEQTYKEAQHRLELFESKGAAPKAGGDGRGLEAASPSPTPEEVPPGPSDGPSGPRS